jgi:long-chain acyl-CoA synthetase
MPQLSDRARATPGKVAVRMADADHEVLTFAELDRRADAVAGWLVSLGLQPGDSVALLLENCIELPELWFGARRAGLYYVPIAIALTAGEIVYLLRDSGARALITSPAFADRLAALPPQVAPLRASVGGDLPGCIGYEAARDAQPDDTPLPERPLGRELFYSSGTTGRPKGIRRPLTPFDRRVELPPFERTLRGLFTFDADAVYLSPSPLYHATGRFVIRAVEGGGTAVILRRFDAAEALAAIDRWRVTHSHWVPTMFVRMLALPVAVRTAFDGTRHRVAIHAAAPCPPEVKQRMIDWWGPIVEEYYGGTENVGVTYLSSAEWLAHRGSVGRAIVGEIRIVDDAGCELPPGEVGLIRFSGGPTFEYLNDPDRTRDAIDDRGWASYGDIGWVDADGYLYISDRRTDLILSGGVNVYPQEIENVLLGHPAVVDAAVVGVPDPEFGEQVKALVALRDPSTACDALRDTLLDHCAAHLSRIKCPRSIDFEPELPRSDTGKLLRRVLKARYRLTEG